MNELMKTEKISLTLDAWFLLNKITFLRIIVYFITPKWEYRHALIGFEELSGEHTGENFSEIVTPILERYNISKKLFAITTDNAGNNSTLMHFLEQSVQEITEDASYEIFHIPCLAHVIQLAVNAFTNELKVMAENEDFDRCISEESIEAVKKEEKGFYQILKLVSMFKIA